MPLGLSEKEKHAFAQYKGQWVDIGIGDKTHCGMLHEIRDDGYFVLSPYLKIMYTSHDLPYRLEISHDQKTIGPEGHYPLSVNPVAMGEVETRMKEYERSFQHAWKEREQHLSELEKKVQEEKK